MQRKLLLVVALVIAAVVGYGQMRRGRGKGDAKATASATVAGKGAAGAQGAAGGKGGPASVGGKDGGGVDARGLEAAKANIPKSVNLASVGTVKDLSPQALASLEAARQKGAQGQPQLATPKAAKELPAPIKSLSQTSAKRWCGEGRCGGCQTALMMLPAPDRAAHAAAACSQGCSELCVAKGQELKLLPPVMSPSLKGKLGSIKTMEKTNGAH
jgi:hypothetical protein